MILKVTSKPDDSMIPPKLQNDLCEKYEINHTS